MGQAIVASARSQLAKHRSCPSDDQITYAVFGSRQLRDLSCFNACEAGSDDEEPKTKFVWSDDGIGIEKESRDRRKSRTIKNYGENNFAL